MRGRAADSTQELHAAAEPRRRRHRLGAGVGHRVQDLPALSVGARLFACRGGFTNPYLRATSDELGGELRVVHAWDLRDVALAGGAVGGVSLLHQAFDVRDGVDVMARTSPAAHIGVTASAGIDVSRDVYATVELDALTSFYREEHEDGAAARAAFALRGNLLVGKRW